MVYKGHLNRPLGRELVAIKTGKGTPILHGVAISVYWKGWDDFTSCMQVYLLHSPPELPINDSYIII